MPYLELPVPIIFADTALDGSLLWSPYLQFACSVDPRGSLLYIIIILLLAINRNSSFCLRRKKYVHCTLIIFSFEQDFESAFPSDSAVNLHNPL